MIFFVTGQFHIIHIFLRHSPNSSGSSTPTNSLNDSNFDGQDSDQLSDTRSIQSQILSPGKDEEYDSVQGNDIPPLQNRRVRNPTSVLQRISSLMAIRNNVRIRQTYMLIVHAIFARVKPNLRIIVNYRTIYRATNTPNSINFGCQTTNQRNATSVRKNFQHSDENIIAAFVDKYFARGAAIKWCRGKLSIVRVSY